MKPNLAPRVTHEIQAVPADEIQSAAPDLYAITGGGEGSGSDHGERPDLRLVTDAAIEAADPDLAEAVDGTAALTEGEPAEEDARESLGRYLTVAKEAGKRTVRRLTPESGITSGTNGEDGEEHKSGGGWYLRQLIEKAMKKMAAKTHPEGCSCEYHEDH